MGYHSVQLKKIMHLSNFFSSEQITPEHVNVNTTIDDKEDRVFAPSCLGTECPTKHSSAAYSVNGPLLCLSDAFLLKRNF